MRRTLAVVILLLLALTADAVPLRKLCNKGCAAAIDACVGGVKKKKAKCKREVLKRCRKTGIAACATTTTSTSSTSSTSTSSTSTSTSTSTSSTSTTSTTLPGTLNGCDLASATDLTAQGAVTITFTDFVYSPSCLVVTAGTEVTFDGVFSAHPLVGGTVAASVQTPDGPSNPITATSTGTSRTFTMSAIGGYGFYCDTHALPPLDMKGAIFVVAPATTTSTSTTTSTTLPAVNACDPATATDLTAQSAVTVNFANFAYSPSCLRVRAGTQVTFEGMFTFHPLVGGTASDQTKTPDPSSPIPATSSGTSTAVTLPVPGAFGFYCDNHGTAPTNMKGAVFVVAD